MRPHPRGQCEGLLFCRRTSLWEGTMEFPRRKFLHLAAALPLVSRMTRAQAYPTRPCVSSLASCRRRERHPRLGELLAHHVEGENEQLGKRDPWYYLSPHHSRSYMLRSHLISSDRRLVSRQELGGRASVHVWLCGNDIELSSLLDQFRDLLSIISQPGP